jgi:hypothetical protein
MLGFAGVREMYEGRIEVLRYSATLQTYLWPKLISLQTGPVGYECHGKLAPPFRDAGGDLRAVTFSHLHRVSNRLLSVQC